VHLPLEGATIRGKYKLGGRLGEGGVGVVFEALEVTSRSRVALKILRPEMLERPDIVARFEREARAASRLTGQNAVRVRDVDTTDEGIPYIAMDLLEGHDLSIELEVRGRLPPDEAVHYILQACRAMGEAHSLGIIHRDLKPSNLFLCEDQGTRRVLVLDFGVSKILDEAGDLKLTKTATTFGTPFYMSPEQVRSMKNIDHRTDIWSLGVVLYELLVGRPPFVGSATGVGAAIVAEVPAKPRAIRRELPDGLERVVMRALAKDPNERFRDIASFAAALAPYDSRHPISSHALASVRHLIDSKRASLSKLEAGSHHAPTEVAIRSKSQIPPQGGAGAAMLIVVVLCFLLAALAGGYVVYAIMSEADPSPPSPLPEGPEGQAGGAGRRGRGDGLPGRLLPLSLRERGWGEGPSREGPSGEWLE
jgi:serine/threonine-protein kinase